MATKSAVHPPTSHVARPPTETKMNGGLRSGLAISASPEATTEHHGKDKVLICHYFERAYAIAAAEVASRAANNSSSENSTPTGLPLSSRAPPGMGRRSSLESDRNSLSMSANTGKDDPNFICHLFPLTPSVKEPLRFSQRSGRQLSESEALQLKHAEEYQFLLPTLTYALQHTITAHDEMLAQEKERRKDEIQALRDAIPRNETSISMNSTSISAAFNVGNILCPSVFEAFITPDIPPVTLLEYLKRIIKFTYASPSVLMVACLYIDRLLARWEGLLFHTQVAFKLIIASVRIASKVLDTRTLNNKDFAVVGGVSNEELNELELHFAANIDYDVYVSAEEFGVYANDLIEAAAGKPQPPTILFDRSPQPPSQSSSTPTSPAALGAKRNRRASIAAVLPTGRRRRYSIVGQGPSPNLRAASRPGAPPTEGSSIFEMDPDTAAATTPTHTNNNNNNSTNNNSSHTEGETGGSNAKKRPSLTSPVGNSNRTSLPQVTRKGVR